MAFDPFESFRKNSKMLIAVMAIVCMFTFVLSSGMGGGDFFDWLGRQFGEGKRGTSKDEIATYFGKAITRTELDRIRRGRVAANQYMFEATLLAGRQSLRQLERDVQTKSKITDPDTLRAFSEFFKAQEQEKTFNKDTSRLEIEEVRRQIEGSFKMLENLRTKLDEKTKPEELKAINKLMGVFDNERRYRDAAQSKGGLYFLTAPNNTDLDALEFDLLFAQKPTRWASSIPMTKLPT